MEDRPENEFQDLLDAARRGEGPGYDGLVRLIDRRLVGFLRARGAHDPESLANDVMVRMCRAIDTFDGNEAQFRAWVFTIARNRMADEHRHFSRRPTAHPVAPSDIPEGEGEALSSDLDQMERVEALLDGLNEVQREVMLLRVVGGLSVQETARAMGKRQGAIRALQHRALQQLRSQMAEGA